MGDHWRIAPRLCMAWSGRRFASHRPVRLVLAGYWAVLGVRESRRRLAPHRPVWGLLAGYCPWEASPPLMAEAWSPVQIHLAGSPPVGGGLPVGCLASCWRRPVPGAAPSRGEEIST